MDAKLFVLTLCAVLALSLGEEFHCDTLVPYGNQAEIATTSPKPFTIRTTRTEFAEGESLVVTIKAQQGEDLPFTKFFMQARRPTTNKPVGTFGAQEGYYHVTQCDAPMDTATAISAEPPYHTEMEIKWKAPEVHFDGDIEFIATIQDGKGKLWTDVRSILLRPTQQRVDPHDPQQEEQAPVFDQDEFEETQPRDMEEESLGTDPDDVTPPQDPEENPNGEEIQEEERRRESERRDREGEERDRLREEMEEEKRKQEEDDKRIDPHGPEYEMMLAEEQKRLMEQSIRDEDAYSEADWQLQMRKEKEEHQEEMHREEMEAERMAQEEHQRHMEMMLWEMKDKEEHDALMAQQQTTTTTMYPIIIEDEDEVVEKEDGGKKEEEVELDDNKNIKTDDNNNVVADSKKANDAGQNVLSIVLLAVVAFVQLF